MIRSPASQKISVGPVPGVTRSVVTIGAFDGVHLGHQSLVRSAIAAGQRHRAPVIAWTFDPPPRVFFGKAPPLMTPEEKVARLLTLGVDHVILSHFDEAFRARTAAEFLQDLGSMGPLELWVGDDFRFGAGQQGNVETLATLAPVQRLEPVLCRKGLRISSSRIRTLLKQGDYTRVRELIGWNDFYVYPGYETAW